MKIGLFKIPPILSILPAVLFCGCCQISHPKDIAAMNKWLLRQIERKDISEEELLECISHLGRNVEPPLFWSRIIDDDSYSLAHRSRCTMALFRRHGELCEEVRQLGKILGSAKWLHETDVRIITYLDGVQPLSPGSNSTVFALSVPGSQSVVYLRVVDEMELKDFMDTLHDVDNHKDASVLQYAYYDDYRKWLLSNTPQSYHRKNVH